MQPQATLCIPKVALHSPHSILHTSRFTLHFISSHLIKAHLISSQMSSKFFSIPFISSEQCSSFKCLHTEALTHSTLLHTANFYTQKFLLSEFLHVDTLTPQRNFQTHNFLHKFLHTANVYKQHTFTHRNLYTKMFLRTEAFTRNGTRNYSSKTGSRRRSQKKTKIEKNLLTNQPFQ